MFEKIPEIVLKPIGIVRSELKQPMGSSHPRRDIVSEIIVDPALTDYLEGVEKLDHLVILFWMHLLDSTIPPRAKIHPHGNRNAPLQGLFTTRTPHRPNRIGLTTVKLLGREGNILRVQGLDAIDGTPVIDIKPFITGHDATGGSGKPPGEHPRQHA